MADPSRQSTAPPKPALTRMTRWLWNQQGFLWGTVIVGIALNLFASWLITPVGTSFSQTPLGTLLGHPVFFVGAGVSLLLLTGGLWLVNRRSSASPLHRLSARPLTEADRHSVIRLLHQEYDKRLAQSLQGAVMLALRLHERTEMVRSAAHLVFRRTDRAQETPLPPGTTILQAYEQAGQRLLILGAPGAGKTTLLLNLASSLLARAHSDSTHPIAVILNLSSWADKRPPLDEFLIDQLSLVYGIPSRLGQMLLEQEQWLLLLDGLDEVEASARSACIEAINSFREEHFTPLVVCSRSQEYVQEQARLALSGAVEIQPLQEQEVKEYLRHLGKPMAAVRAALRTNPALKQLLTTPLMLNVVTLAYQDATMKDLLKSGSMKEQQGQIFKHYLERMLVRQISQKRHFRPAHLSRQLAILAYVMKKKQLTEFYLERLHPYDWLPQTKFAQWGFLVSVTLVPMLLWTPFLLSLGVFFWVSLLFALPLSFLTGFVLHLSMYTEPNSRREWLRDAATRKWLRQASFAERERWWSHRLSPQFAETVRWSWQDFRVNVNKCLLAGLILSLIGEGVIWSGADLRTGLSFASCIMFPLTLAACIMCGLSRSRLNEQSFSRPNEGIRHAGKNALLFGLTGAFLGTLSSGLFMMSLSGWDLSQLLSGWPFALVLAVIGGMYFGGSVYLAHYLLRFFLWQYKVLPWFAVHFLEEATERILLQGVGGGYRFIHPLFQEYLASVIETEVSPKAQVPTPSSRP
jgi:DNA polymerase III delta prime subunit